MWEQIKSNRIRTVILVIGMERFFSLSAGRSVI